MGSVSVARRLGCDKRQANIVGLLVGSNPVTLAMSATVMPDVMAAAFGVWGVDRTLAFREEQRAGAGAAAGVLLAAAVLCRGNCMFVLVAAALLLLPSEWKRLPACWWPVAIAVALAAMWLVLQHGSAMALRSLTGVRNVPRNLVGFLAFQALTGPLLLYWLLSAGWRWITAAAAVIAAGIALSFIPSPNLATYAVPASLSICVVAACVLAVRGLRYAAPLIVWLCAGLGALPYVYMSAKYLLPGVPAAALLIVLHAARVRQPRYPLIVALLIAAGWICGAAIIVGDTTLADSQRRAVQERMAPAIRRGRTVWAGGQWAFLEYAQRAGAQTLGNTPPLPQPGDTVVVSRLDYFGLFDKMPFQRDLVSTTRDWRCGIFVLNRRLGAGFYSNRFGYLPFAVGCGEVNRYDTYRVAP
jgi:hypothetical protein